MYPIDSRIDTADGTWLHCSIDVPVPAARAFEELATAEGMSAWFSATSLEPQVGGTIMHFADAVCDDEEATTCGEVTAYAAPTEDEDSGEFAWVERGWMGEGMPVPDWVTEFEVCSVAAGEDPSEVAGANITMRSGMASGSELATTSVGESELTWRQGLLCLAHRLAVFPEGRVRTLQVHGEPTVGTVPDRWSALVQALGMTTGAESGETFSASGVAGTVIDMAEGAAVFALSEPAMGTLNLFAYPDGEDAEAATERCAVAARFTEFVTSSSVPEWEAADWNEWLEMLVPVV